MADAPETVIKVGADTKPAEQAAESLFDVFKGGLTELNSGLELVNKAAQAISKTLSTAIDFAKSGEEIRAIGMRFEAIASQAGLIPENISAGIEKAVKGTVDMEDALKAATQAIVSLEVGSEKIPQVFELAKKSAALFGGEVTDRFEQITMAVASGSTRILRSIGIVVDADKAFKDYAKTLDITPDKLTQAERQQAILNAVLEKGEERFKNVNSSITPIAENLKRLNVASKEVGDTFATAFNNAFGDVINQKIQSFTKSIEVLNIQLSNFLFGQAPTAAQNIKLLNQQLNDLMVARDMAAVRGDIGRLEQIEAESQAIRNQIIAQQSLVFQEQTKQALQGNAINLNNSNAASVNRLTESQKLAAEEAKKAAEEQKKASEKAADYLKQQGEMVKKTFQNIVANGISNAFSSLGKALVQGGDAFGEFGRQALSMIGALAIQMGQFLILAGLGWSVIPGFQKSAGAVVAGVALTVLGGVLQALGSGGGTPAAAGTPAATAAGGGTIAYENPMVAQTQEQEREAAQTGVQVIVQGNIFDSRETGLQIAQIINDSFDLNGTIIRANA